jgi:hypothetical protein
VLVISQKNEVWGTTPEDVQAYFQGLEQYGTLSLEEVKSQLNVR